MPYKKIRKDHVRDMCISRSHCAEAAAALISGFTWSATKEGAIFWGDVRARILQIGSKAK